jgi:hypothetical protein
MGMWKLDLHPIIEHRLWKALNNSLPTELTCQIEEFSMQDVVHVEITSKNIDHHPAIRSRACSFWFSSLLGMKLKMYSLSVS